MHLSSVRRVEKNECLAWGQKPLRKTEPILFGTLLQQQMHLESQIMVNRVESTCRGDLIEMWKNAFFVTAETCFVVANNATQFWIASYISLLECKLTHSLRHAHTISTHLCTHIQRLNLTFKHHQLRDEKKEKKNFFFLRDNTKGVSTICAVIGTEIQLTSIHHWVT